MNESLKLHNLSEMILKIEEASKIPVGIDLIDRNIGGIIHGHIHAIFGESGSGKTWFCLKVIDSFLKDNNSAKIGYVDFSANLRGHHLEIMLSKKNFLTQIDFFQPNNLFETMIFTKTLLDRTEYDLLVFDTIFGSPLQILETLRARDQNWGIKILNFLFNLRKIAKQNKIPVLITHNLTVTNNNLIKDKEYLNLEPFILQKFLLNKSEEERFLELSFLQEKFGKESIHLYS